MKCRLTHCTCQHCQLALCVCVSMCVHIAHYRMTMQACSSAVLKAWRHKGRVCVGFCDLHAGALWQPV